MHSKAVKCLFLTLAMLSLAFSAVAACACTHHLSKKVESEPLSCHGKPHEESSPQTVNIDPGTTRFDDRCSCYVRNFEAAIIAKSETKPTKAEKVVSVDACNAAQIEVVVGNVELTALGTLDPSNFYSTFLLRSGPSRAPPRL